MRMPSELTLWFTTDQLMEWVKEAQDKAAYLCVLRLAVKSSANTYTPTWPFAHKMAR